MPLPPLSADLMLTLTAALRAGQPAAAGAAEAHIPVERYFSEAQWQAERDTLFRRYPLVVAHTADLGPGQVLALDRYGLPLLLTREADGTLHAFLNVCRHRGMRLLEPGAKASAHASIVCPYHGWTYQLDGPLRHVAHADSFDPADAGARDLVRLDVSERLGLVWVMPEPGRPLALDGWLGALDAELQWLGLEDHVVYRSVEAEYPANWKLIVDAFLEPYHIRVLHRNTIAPFFTEGFAASARVGPHIHSLVARRTAQATFEEPADPEALRQLTTPSAVIFPNLILIFHPDYVSLIALYPVAPERLHWTHRMLIPRAKNTPDWTPHWEKTFGLIEQTVFQQEDLFAATGIQRGLKSGANRHLTFGRMEQPASWFHEAVMAALDRHGKSENITTNGASMQSPALPSPQARDVIDFWLDAGPKRWFAKDTEFDARFRERFAAAHESAARGELNEWSRSAEGALALLVLLDQYPRNSFRDTARMFATDEQARQIARAAIAAGFDAQVDPALRSFFYMPLMHSEDLADQDLCVRLCEGKDPGTLRFAHLHREIIERFGRFPHRNPLLGRTTTPEEAQFLSEGGFAG